MTKRIPNTNLKPYLIPSYYDHASLERGYKSSSNYKNPKGVVSLDK